MVISAEEIREVLDLFDREEILHENFPQVFAALIFYRIARKQDNDEELVDHKGRRL